jgi:2-C-methyl-D-erythritol 4-phosphate cytidylyltransferase
MDGGVDGGVAAVVLAGGSGVRVGQGRNKAYLPISGRTAVGMSLRTMATVPGLRRLVLVVREGDEELAERTLDEELPRPPVPVELVRGGTTRHGSEEHALRHLEPAIQSSAVTLVLIHDAARPLCSPGLVAELVRGGPVLDGDDHVVHLLGQRVGDAVERVSDQRLEPLLGHHHHDAIVARGCIETAHREPRRSRGGVRVRRGRGWPR